MRVAHVKTLLVAPLVALFGLYGAAMAQEGDTLREVPSDDPILEALNERDGLEASGTVAEERPATDPDTEKQIERNYRKASQTYRRILEENDTNTETLQTRIKNLEELIAETRPKVEGAAAAQRTLEVDFMNRMYFMRQQHDQGKLDDATFERLSKEEKELFEQKSRQLKADTEFYQSDLQSYEELVADLRSELRLVEAKVAARERTAGAMASANRQPAPKRTSEVVLEGLDARLVRLSGFNTRRIGEPLTSPQDYRTLER